MSERWLTIKQAAETHGIARWLLYHLISIGKGPPVTRIGRAIRVREQALDEWMIAQEEQQQAKDH